MVRSLSRRGHWLGTARLAECVGHRTSELPLDRQNLDGDTRTPQRGQSLRVYHQDRDNAAYTPGARFEFRQVFEARAIS